MIKKILVVEDDLFLRQLYEDILKEEQYEVTSAIDGEEALLKIQQGAWDLVLLDFILPKLNALQILKELQKHPPKEKNKKLVLMTNLDESSDFKLARTLTDGYILKSAFTPDKFLEKIKQYLA